jgi:hypothetical protein
MASADEIARMSKLERIAEALRRSIAHLPAEGRAMVESMLDPTSLALIGGTLVVWIGSHAFGIGEFVDLVLLGAGVVTLGFSALEGAKALYDFATGAFGARSESDLDQAGQSFAKAVLILGVSTVQAILLHGQARATLARGRPQLYPPPEVGPTPPAGNQLRISRPATLPGRAVGGTTGFGEISIARDQTLTEQRITLLHELVHRYFSPRTGPLRRLRAELKMSAYARSVLLRYLEEALAEGYAQLRVNGLAAGLRAYRFPLRFGYVTVSQLAAEGKAIGTIILGGTTFHVSVSLGASPSD